MKLVFKKVIIDNFFSVGHIELDLDFNGITAIYGKNNYDTLSKSNGAGKSSIFEAILWNLTGYTSRGTSSVKNIITNTRASVELHLSIDSDDYIITRKSDPSSLNIIKSGSDISGSTFMKSKKVLSDILGSINYESISSIIILSQGLGGRLSNYKPSDRKSRLELFSNLQEIVNDISSKVDKIFSNISVDNSSKNSTYNSFLSNMDNYNSLLNDYNSNIKELNDKKATLSKLDYDSLVKEQDDLSKILESLSDELLKLKDDHERLVSKKSLLDRDLSIIKNSLIDLRDKYKSLLNKRCPTCNQVILDESLVSSYEDKIKVLYNDYNNKKLEASSIQLDDNYQNLYNDILSKKSTTSNKYRSLSDTIKEFSNIESSIHTIESMIKPIQSKIDNMKNDLPRLKIDLMNSNQDLEIAKWYKKSVSRKFRNFLLESVVEYINNRLKYYSQYMFSDRLVKFVSSDNNLSIYLGDLEFENLSGGEGRRADLVIQLALRDLSINQSGFYCNLLVMDEVFDNLDSAGINNLLSMIDKEGLSESLMIITHNDTIDLPISRNIEIVKNEEGVSSIGFSELL